jgi:hypothetical protein
MTQDTTTIPIITTPPTTTIPVDTGNGAELLIPNWVIPVVILAVVLLYFIWQYLTRKEMIESGDVMPTLTDLDSEGVSINTASLVQLLMVLPALGAFIWAAMDMNAGGDPIRSGAIAAAVIGFQIGLMSETRRRTREKHSGMRVLTGWMRTVDGSKRKYYWRKVEIMTGRRLSDDDYDAIAAQTDDEWNKERLEALHTYPILIDNKAAVYVITSAPESEAFEWVKDSDWDYFGDFDTYETGPELHEMAIIHRVTNDYTEGEDETWIQKDEYIRVFVTAWDDFRSVQYRGSVQGIDVTRTEIIGQIAKALGVQYNITAGMLNTKSETLMNVLNDQRKLEVMASAIGHGMAAGIIDDKEALSTLDKLGEGINWTQLIIYGVVFFFGWVLGNSGFGG